ncbi:hypothetical protein KIH77_07630 [Bifidobacterium sp. 82T24]|uniref:pectinesterase family protein n=1 Tax=Bifidobacterium pluvialisilvae TaxID=2834436 RepID=UPI001C59E966|nr:pectinesterase family protein [Bifidobacterium pluvialisilvae]MBW3088596.1 hypothetical protein [Bifidobacterium pluvialisilvae]
MTGVCAAAIMMTAFAMPANAAATPNNTAAATPAATSGATAKAPAAASSDNAGTNAKPESNDNTGNTNNGATTAGNGNADTNGAGASDAPNTGDTADFPGTPGTTEAKDVTTTFDAADGLKDASGNPIAADATGVAKLEAAKGSFGAIKIDATTGKFAMRTTNKDVQINAGTVLYIPVAYDAKGVSLKIASAGGNAAITVDGKDATTNQSVAIAGKQTDFPKYVTVRFTAAAYATAITVDYSSDSGYGTPDVKAVDRTYTFNTSKAALLKDAAGKPVDAANPAIQGAKGSFDDIKIDALSGKFLLRASDTQVNSGTVLYLPIAADSKGATVTVQSSGANGVKLTLDGDDIAAGTAKVVDATEARYVALAVNSTDPTLTGSFYLTSISVDYGSNEPATTNRTVTVGHGRQYRYQSIQQALNANDSSLTDRLVLQIAPGDYREKITVAKPGVVFENGDKTATHPVVIHEAYYAAMGTVTPQANPKYDASRAAGTNTSGTVSVQSGADGFTAYGITFRNDFNISVHPEAGSQTPAVALYTAADKINLVNCRLIGRQDTVWFNGNGRVNVANSYIEGTVDFVFGSADAYIHDTQLHMAHFAGKDNGYFTAPNTNKAHTGLVFDKCRFTADAANAKVTLGRPWQTEVKQVKNAAGVITGYDFSKQEGADGQGVYPMGAASATTLLESTVASNVGAKVSGTKAVTRWSTWSRKLDGKNVDVTYHPAVRFAEYNSVDENGVAAPTYDYDSKLGGDNTKRTDFLIGHGETLAADQLAAKRTELLAAMHIGDGLGDWNPAFGYVGQGMAIPTTPTTGNGGNGANGSGSATVSTGSNAGNGQQGNGNALARTGVDVIAVAGTMLMIAAAGAVMVYRRMLSR